MNLDENNEIAVLGAGCFWCVETIFKELKGVLEIYPGYTGGITKNPSYKEVCVGDTMHAEVCWIKFDKNIISFKELLEVFWTVHDPTSLNKQGDDIGNQYRSVIFYTNNEQKEISYSLFDQMDTSDVWDTKLVTEISPLTKFYKAEQYHKDYYDNNSDEGYCNMIIKPKKEKFKKIFSDKLK